MSFYTKLFDEKKFISKRNEVSNDAQNTKSILVGRSQLVHGQGPHTVQEHFKKPHNALDMILQSGNERTFNVVIVKRGRKEISLEKNR